MDKTNLREMKANMVVKSTVKLELLSSYDPLGAIYTEDPGIVHDDDVLENLFRVLNRSCNAFLDKHSNYGKTTIMNQTVVQSTIP